MNNTNRLAPSELYQRCDPAQFTFANTSGLDLAGILGQGRARAAIVLGLGIHREGHNLFVLVPTGAGNQTLLRQILASQTTTLPTLILTQWPNRHCGAGGGRPLFAGHRAMNARGATR